MSSARIRLVYQDTLAAYADNTGSFPGTWDSISVTVDGNDPTGVTLAVLAGTSYAYSFSGTIDNGAGLVTGPDGTSGHSSVLPFCPCPMGAPYASLVGLFTCAPGSSSSSSGGCCGTFDLTISTGMHAGTYTLTYQGLDGDSDNYWASGADYGSSGTDIILFLTDSSFEPLPIEWVLQVAGTINDPDSPQSGTCPTDQTFSSGNMTITCVG